MVLTSQIHSTFSLADWQTRLALGLPIGVGYAPYGWAWGDKDKTFYIIDPETAAVRLSIFVMFVELDMSLRAIAHKLTEDKILTPSDRRKKQQERKRKESQEKEEEEEQPAGWSLTTISSFLQDTSVLGILTVCKQKDIITPEGKKSYIPHEAYREIPGGIPAIISTDLYERAQRKIAGNQQEKSHPPKEPEKYLLSGHVICETCNYKMGPFTHTIYNSHYYRCRKRLNNFDRCPSSSVMLRADYANEIVWQEMCLLFERLERLQTTIEQEVAEKLVVLLEDSTGQQQLLARQAEIEVAQKELEKQKKGTYMYALIEQDIGVKQEQLARFKEELGSTSDLVKVTALYQERVLSFFNFLLRMRGRYHEATFQEKRNALDVLGVEVIAAPPQQEEKPSLVTDAWPEWLTLQEAAEVLGLKGSGLRRYIDSGAIQVWQEAPHMPIHIHCDEVRQLAEKKVSHLPMTKEQVRSRLTITYSPQFTMDYALGAQAHSLQV